MNNESVISKLLPQSLIDVLPEPELKGLGLLAREIADSDIFEIDDEYNIHTMYHDVRVSLHVHESVKRRLKGGNRHLSCSVEFWEYDICILVPGGTPATDDCLLFLLLAKYGWRKDMVPRTLFRPMNDRLEAIQAAKKKRLKHERRNARFGGTEKEQWEWILSHFTTEKGVYIPDYY